MGNLSALSRQLRPGGEENNELLTKQELAARLRVSTRTIDNWMAEGKLSYLKLGKAVRFHWSTVLENLSRFRVG